MLMSSWPPVLVSCSGLCKFVGVNCFAAGPRCLEDTKEARCSSDTIRSDETAGFIILLFTICIACGTPLLCFLRTTCFSRLKKLPNDGEQSRVSENKHSTASFSHLSSE
uniref:Uncharacterized protein n=1 Tax=Opuntia streptacantha TaxID=393608 RepID=A0A7C8YGD3_OPUST